MRGLAACLAVLAFLVAGSTVRASDDPQALFQQGAAALKEGSYHRAVELFEALADDGYLHPDASFDRALAYIGRVKAGADRPGDLGRAAAALEEVLLLRPDDRDAEGALETVRAEVARRRARNGASAEVESRPSPERALIGLAPESTWALLALVSSLLLTVGLVLRAAERRKRATENDDAASPVALDATGPLHLAGVIARPIGAVALVLFASLAAGARHMRQTTADGVIVAPEARLTDERGVAATGGPIPEAAKVELSEQRGALVHVRWGTIEGFVPSSAALRIARP
jgi:tetratricopeptide (TPR) repeat protein